MANIQIMRFHQSRRATRMCNCYVDYQGIGHDALGYEWRTITDDYGNIVFVR